MRLTKYACGAAALYALSMVAGGLIAFAVGIETLTGCLRDPANTPIGSWLLGLSWLANPPTWAGVLLLFSGARRQAAYAGGIGLALAACAGWFPVWFPGFFLCYLPWVGSMALVVYAARRPVATASPAPEVKPADRAAAALRAPVIAALGLPLLVGALILTSSCFGPDQSELDTWGNDPNTNVRTGEHAREKFLRWAERTVRRGSGPGALPASATNFWFYEDGGFNRSLEFGVFDCGSREDCLRAVEYLGDVLPAELHPWEPSDRAVVMEGPGFYSRGAAPGKELRGSPWDVPAIKNGLVCERNPRDRYLAYFAIDLDRNRVYSYEAIGGYPSDEYRSAPGGTGGQAKPERRK